MTHAVTFKGNVVHADRHQRTSYASPATLDVHIGASTWSLGLTDLGTKLRWLRTTLNITSVGLAAAMGASRSTIHRLEAGGDFTMSTLNAYVRALQHLYTEGQTR